MPDPTDFVTDLPADFEIFGDAVDTTVDSIDNRVTDLEVITTEGDLVVGDASGDPVRVSVGTAGQVLASDGDTVEWITPATGVAPLLTVTTSGIYVKSTGHPGFGDGAGNEDRTDYTPVFLPNCTLDRLAVRCTARTTTGNVRLGIYNNGTDNKPGTLLLDAGTVSITATGLFEVTISQAITAGWYWLAANGQSGNFDLAHYSTADEAKNVFMSNWQNSPDHTNDINYNGYRQTGISGAFPASATVVNPINSLIMTWARMA
jgi:hypothetical protein